MSGKSFLLMLLETAVGVAVWILGWPILREIQTAFNIIAAIVVSVLFLTGISIVIAIYRSQREPPYV